METGSVEMSKTDDFPVDMVYLWCDGKDPEFLRRKAEFSEEAVGADEEAVSRVRFFDNEELKYSLRSLEKYAPWIRHVFIVTDRQKPEWLDTENPKVTIVDHSEIMPKELIPCFNSSVIERYIGFIPGLSEHFLYANDDGFFGPKVSKGFFFRDGKPIVRMWYYGRQKNLRTIAQFREYVADNFYGKPIVNAHAAVRAKNHLKDDMPFLEMHHNIDAYVKTDYVNTFLKYKEELDRYVSRFRSTEDIQRVLFGLEMLLNERGELHILEQYHKVRRLFFILKRTPLESYYSDADRKQILILWCLRPMLFCINNSGAKESGNKMERMYLEHRFPKKSSFEK